MYLVAPSRDSFTRFLTFFFSLNPLLTASTKKDVWTWNLWKIAKNTICIQIAWFLLYVPGNILPSLQQQKSEAKCPIYSTLFSYYKNHLFYVIKVKLTFFSEKFVLYISQEPFKIFQKFEKIWICWEISFKMPYEVAQLDYK